MTCANCGATIAEKAIVCYRCGTATAIPETVRRPRATPPETAPVAVVIGVVVGMLGLVGVGIWLMQDAEPGVSAARIGAAASMAGAAALALVLVILRRRGKLLR